MNPIKHIKIYLPFCLNSIKTNITYRVSFCFYLLGTWFGILVQYYLWKAIFSSAGHKYVLSGFTFQEMVTYVIMNYITSSIISSFGANDIAYDIADGSIAVNLIKPINYKLRVMADSIGNLIFKAFVINLPIWVIVSIWRYFSAGERVPSIAILLLYILSMCLSFLVLFLFDFCFGMISFYTTYFFGINIAKQVIIRFFSGGIIPLAFFPGVLQTIFKFLPFASMNYTAVMIYLGKLSIREMWYAIGIQCLWVVILEWLSVIFWRKAIKRITILGG